MGHHCCSKQKVKRGLWSPEEDEKLVRHITTHGHGCWSAVPKLAGLQRCGKSCRLRWINYLRPDLKRGSFTEQEERVIIDVHRILGNRWAQIAKHLPGRTDNEVKNFWNSCIKKKLIAQGLDPNTHNLLSSHKINGHSNGFASKTSHNHNRNTSVFSISTSHSNNDAYVDMKTPFHHTNSINPIPTSLYENSTITTATTAATTTTTTTTTTSEYQNPNFASNQNAHSLMEFGSRSSMEMATLPSYSLNPSGFGMFDESCMWGSGTTTGLEHFHEPTRHEMIMQVQHENQQQQQQREQEKAKFEGQNSTNMENLLIGNMSSNFDFEFVESALMPCGLYGNVSPMDDQLAWDC
ncbi:hypothetical protein Vadar_005377 [Vaccinium darrowii]|uniref:Uncharacterized protein n=1 Tax=Vaccinium darrowii TaxID=229202 RepID=A0ACB7X7R3_9ERIC|nr:hypothetical protein Vadar_005377 [Vaccinium darrowii]